MCVSKYLNANNKLNKEFHGCKRTVSNLTTLIIFYNNIRDIKQINKINKILYYLW